MFATRANFSHQSDGITEDMIAFLKDYILVSANPNAMYIDVTIEVEEEVKFMRTFKPLELSILVDNFISNAQKAKAPCINFKISVKEDTLNIIVNDNGDGLGPDIDISRIFDLAYSGTQGSGIGLFHIKSVLSQLNGTVKLLKTPNNEAKFLVEINNEN
jgi:sensor histidine kinase regulating citrate/malate metabolism